ncbi:MAG: hypothetical protein ACHBN1_02670 [Heteroscytonema crispum UTEX LB 1556]
MQNLRLQSLLRIGDWGLLRQRPSRPRQSRSAASLGHGKDGFSSCLMENHRYEGGFPKLSDLFSLWVYEVHPDYLQHSSIAA